MILGHLLLRLPWPWTWVMLGNGPLCRKFATDATSLHEQYNIATKSSI